MIAYLDANCVIYFVEQNPSWWPRITGRIVTLRAAGDEIAVSDLTRTECLVGPFTSGDAAALASYQHLLVDQLLGRLRVTDVMVTEPVILPPDLSVAEAIEKYFLHLGFGGFPVVSDGQVLGLVSLAQVSGCPAEQRATRRVRDIMRPLDATIVIPVSATVAEALHKMAQAEAGRLLVMDHQRLAGIITRSGIARLVQMRIALARPVAAQA